ncbi:S1 family peptidase [Streptomyces sp. MAR4 CNX-425]|uniref:S1 family peptidase n=1 Tax=Streptomyces sp. MAR4 CNX-425 TaxID=3406343 RepID=UPI003B5121B6
MQERHKPRRARLTAAVTAAAAVITAATVAAPAQAVVGTAESGDTYAFTARLDIGDGQRACSGALVDSRWLLTAASCFAEDPAAGLQVPAGKPGLKTVATVGRTDLTTTGGQVREVVELVPHGDRDLLLARLARPVTTVSPVPLATTAPAAGEPLTVTGYGRTADEWAPVELHSGSFTVDGVAGADVSITGEGGAAVCAGDTGGPALRSDGGAVELAAVSSRSFQGGCFGTDASVTDTGALSARTDDVLPWIHGTVQAASVTDFNCDGAPDLAAGDPKATVGGHANAGLVRVVHGDGKGTAEIHQGQEAVPGGAQANDWFGEELAVFDHDQDGCSDLAVGIPSEDVAGAVDTGMVTILYGSRDGLGKGRAALSLLAGSGSGAIRGSAAEAGDLMGRSLAAGTTAAGEPFLVIGVPGEDLGTVEDAGSAFYVHGTTSVALNQRSPGVTGPEEKGDRFGRSVTASANHLAIGAPGEAAGSNADAGAIWIFDHRLDNGRPTFRIMMDQATAPLSGGNGAGDQFGAALAMVPHRPATASSATDSVIAVGTPGEGVTAGGVDQQEAGRVVTLRIDAAGNVSRLANIHQGQSGIAGEAEGGDRFGAELAAVNTRPGAVASARAMLLAVGAPREDVGGAQDAGTVQAFSLLGAPGDADVPVGPGTLGIPGAPGAGERVGMSLAATGDGLYLGLPYGPAAHGAVYALPWANVTDGAAEPVTTHRPGANGLPAAGEAFGWAVQ